MSRIVVLILLLNLSLSIVSAYDYVVVDSKDWRDIYLGIMFSTFDNSRVLFFNDLADVDLKTRMIPKNASVLILESKEDAIIKNYFSFLNVRDYVNTESVVFNDFSDLQVALYDKIKDKVNNFIVLNPDFGNEAVVAAPLIKNEKYWPVFLTKKNLGSVVSNFDFDERSIAAGYFPYRLIDFFPGIKFIDVPYKNMIALLNYTLNNVDYDWSTLMILDKVDPDALISGKPIFIYDGNLDLLASLVKETSAERFEIIGGELADVAKELEARSGKDLKLLLKYARTITNLKPYKGKLLDLDAFSVDYPYLLLNIKNVTYYPDLNTLAITFKNNGNFRAFVYTNFEFSDTPYSDKFPLEILPGQELTIPYFVNLSEARAKDFNDLDNLSIVLNVLYGMDFPLENTLEDRNGRPLINQKVFVSDYVENSSLSLVDHRFDNSRGKLLLKVQNNNDYDLVAFAEVSLGPNNILVSKKTMIPKHSEGELVIDTPFLYKEDFYNKTIDVLLYYGNKDTLNAKVVSMEITNFYEQSLITGFIVGIMENDKVLVIIIVALILLILAIVLRKKSKKRKVFKI